MITEGQSDTPARSGCFLCGRTSQSVIWSEAGREGLLCGCGMVYTNQSTDVPSVNAAEEHHPDHFYSLPAPFKAAWVARRCPRGRLVEIGCGAGFFLAAIRNHGYDVFGLEPTRSYDHRLRLLGIPVVHAYIENNDLPKHGVDVVYHCDLLAHFPDPINALLAMCELLRPGGVLAFEVGLLGGISPVWYRLIGRIGLGQHLWLYFDRAFQTLMDRAGLRILHVQYFGLTAEVIGGKVLGILNKRLLSPVLHGILSDGYHRTLQIHRYCVNALRYRVGALLPHVGPQTLMVVAQPKHNDR